MLERLSVYLSILKVLVGIAIMKPVYKLFPWYVAFCYKHARRARAIVYNYWLAFDKQGIKKFKKYLSLTGTSTIIYSGSVSKPDLYPAGTPANEIDNVIEFLNIDNIGTPEYRYLKDFGDNPSTNSIGRLYYYIRYLFYYYTIWIWLDDETNVNGIDFEIVTRTPKLSELTKQYIVKDTRSYVNCFDIKYVTRTELLPLDKITYIVPLQKLNNWLRMNVTYKELLNIGKSFGYRIDPSYRQSVMRIFNKSILDLL